jgi:hypothetical protein
MYVRATDERIHDFHVAARGWYHPDYDENWRRFFTVFAFVLWPAWLLFLVAKTVLRFLTRPHRYAAALVQRMNTPTPIQEPGAFKRREGDGANRLWLRSVAKEANTTGTVGVKPVVVRGEFQCKTEGPISGPCKCGKHTLLPGEFRVGVNAHHSVGGCAEIKPQTGISPADTLG